MLDHLYNRPLRHLPRLTSPHILPHILGQVRHTSAAWYRASLHDCQTCFRIINSFGLFSIFGEQYS